jgi:hypothetical protein
MLAQTNSLRCDEMSQWFSEVVRRPRLLRGTYPIEAGVETFFILWREISILGVILAGSFLSVHGQTASSSSSEQASQPDVSEPIPSPQQNPNGSTAVAMPPLDFRAKFNRTIEPAFGPRALFFDAAFGGIRMAKAPDAYPHEWRSGAEAFGRNYGDAFARTGSLAITRFSTSELLHEDLRYQRSSSGSVPLRLSHALLFTFIDKTDHGHSTLALSNFTGAGAAGFIGNAYLPPGFDNLTHAGQRATFAFGSLAVGNVFQEFAPELQKGLLKIHITHIPLPPVWWTPTKQ